MSEPEALECIDDPEQCRGPVEWRSVDPGRASAVPRCEYHWGERLRRRAHSIERYEHSDVPPPWLDEANAGERWSEDY